MAVEREMIGLEIIVEPDVVPKGTVDLKKLDAPWGAKPPLRRIEPDGRVFMIDEPAKPAPAPEPVAVAAEGGESLGMKLRKKQIHSDTAMPPRPASAESTASGRLSRQPLPDDDYETTVIHGGFGSALWSLVKVTAVLALFTLATVFTYLKWNDLLPWGQGASPQPVAIVPPIPQKLLTPKPDTAPTATPSTTKPDVAKVATDSSASVALDVKPEEKKPEKPVEEPKLAEKPKASGGMGDEDEYDVKAIERLRADAVRLDHEGKYDEALAKLDAILAKNPKDGDALFRRGLIFHKKGDIKGAIKAYEIATNFAGHDARAFNNLGLCYEVQGDIKSARDAYDRGLTHDPEDPNVLTNLGRLEEEQDFKAAFARYEKALERDQRHPQARYHRAALLALRMDRSAEGRKELEALVGVESPVRPEALDALGKLALVESRYGDAEKLLRDALKAGSQDARLYLGRALLEENQAQAAVDELKAYIEKNPKSADAWKTLGAALVRLEQLQDAKAAYEKALAINDKDADTLYNYALCAERFGNFLFAIQEYERVVAIDATHWKALTNLGRLYRNAPGKEEVALGYFEKALKIRPNEPELHLHRANALVALHRDADARAELEQFVKLASPSDPRVAQARRAIESSGPLKPAGQQTSSMPTNALEKPKGF